MDYKILFEHGLHWFDSDVIISAENEKQAINKYKKKINFQKTRDFTKFKAVEIEYPSFEETVKKMKERLKNK
jgi:pyruvate-formate lyase